MSDQSSLFPTPQPKPWQQRTPRVDLQTARVARDAGMRSVDDYADEDWKDRCLGVLQQVAMSLPELTSDDLWAHIEHPREPRALGPMMMKAAKFGWIAPTDRYRSTPAVSRHAAPVRIWRSRVFGTKP